MRVLIYLLLLNPGVGGGHPLKEMAHKYWPFEKGVKKYEVFNNLADNLKMSDLIVLFYFTLFNKDN